MGDVVQELFDNEAISKEAIPAGWNELFRKAVILMERDLDVILEGVVLSISWDYDEAREKLSIEDVKDYLVDVFRYLRGAYEVSNVVILGEGYWEVVHNSFEFVNFVKRRFRLERIIEKVKERWRRRESVVPWWYQEKVKVFEEFINSVIPVVIEICSAIEEVKAVYIRRCRGRLKLHVYLVFFGVPIEYDESNWDELEEVEGLRVKLFEIENELEERFPVVDFRWYSCYESELENVDWFKFSDLELVYEKQINEKGKEVRCDVSSIRECSSGIEGVDK
jgi:hypothetical protein